LGLKPEISGGAAAGVPALSAMSLPATRVMAALVARSTFALGDRVASGFYVKVDNVAPNHRKLDYRW
jgi:hypothetical protein